MTPMTTQAMIALIIAMTRRNLLYVVSHSVIVVCTVPSHSACNGDHHTAVRACVLQIEKSPTAGLVRSGSRSEGSPLSGADQSRHNLVSGGSKDPNHDAAMRIGSEAPKRRTHSFPRHNSHGTNRDPPPRTVIGDHHKRTDRAETVGCLQQPPFIAPGAERRRPAPRPLAQAATRRSEACAPRPRS